MNPPPSTRTALPGQALLPSRDFLTRLDPRVRDRGAGDPRMPRISVVMPSFNHARFIERSLLSVLNQGYPDLELIVVDGGSTDSTVDIIRRYEGYIARWLSERDRGQSDALNKGFARATGEIFGWLNSDDLYLPGALHRAAVELREHPDKGIVFGDWLTIDADDQLIDYERAFDFSLGHFMYEGFHLNAQSMFWRSDVQARYGLFDLGLHRTMDYDMILRFGLNEGEGAFLRVPFAFGAFRRHEAQKTQGFDERVHNEHRRLAELHGYADKYRWPGRMKWLRYRFRRAWWYYRRGGLPHLIDRISGGGSQ